MKINNKAFTLVELLVVVLIIGILAAIAVPQYQKAIEKSKAVQGLSLLKSVDEAIRVYYLTNGTYPSSFNQLDITIPNTFNGTKKFFSNATNNFALSNKDWSLTLEKTSYTTLYMARISGKYKGAGFVIVYETPSGPGGRKIICFERKKDANYLFDTSLGEGAYCNKILQYPFGSEDTWSRLYPIR